MNLQGIKTVIDGDVMIDRNRLASHVRELSTTSRTRNLTISGHRMNTLSEADEYIARELFRSGFVVARETHLAQAFRYNAEKPEHRRFEPPQLTDPWYHIYNIIGRKKGRLKPDEIIVFLAHKDSQSWLTTAGLASPGAYDNATGVAACLELARVFRRFACQRSVWFIFTNEEHAPWSVETAAKNCRVRGDNIIAVINLDGLGGKSQEQIDAGLKTNVSYYATEEGKKLASLMCEFNERLKIGLTQSMYEREKPNDDDKWFILTGYRTTVMNCGSAPYAEPNYHLPTDVAENVDIQNVKMVADLSLVVALAIDIDLVTL